LGEPWRRGDKDRDLDDRGHLVEVAAGGITQMGEEIQRAGTRGLPAFLDGNTAAELAGGDELAIQEGQLSRNEHRLARPAIGDIIGGRRGGIGQSDAEFRQALFSGSGHGFLLAYDGGLWEGTRPPAIGMMRYARAASDGNHPETVLPMKAPAYSLAALLAITSLCGSV